MGKKTCPEELEITEEIMIAGMLAFGSKFDDEPLSQQIARTYRAMAEAQSKPIDRIRISPRLFARLKRALHGHGLAVDDGEQHACGTMGLSPALFPLTHGRGGKAEPCSEGGLRQVQFFPDGPHVDLRRWDNGQPPGQFPPLAIRRDDRRVFPRLVRDFRFGRFVDLRPINLRRSRFVRGDAHDSAWFRGRWLCGRR